MTNVVPARIGEINYVIPDILNIGIESLIYGFLHTNLKAKLRGVIISEVRVLTFGYAKILNTFGALT